MNINTALHSYTLYPWAKLDCPPGHFLNFVREDTRTLQDNLGPTDKRKVEEYLDSVRAIEKQIEKAETKNFHLDPGMEKSYGVPANFAEHFGDSPNRLAGLGLS